MLIVGAGLSGVGAACHLLMKCPGKSVLILEARSAIGGTWDLFRYPGVRSDSDMHTLGYSFRPWTGRKTIADGPSIREYIRDTAQAFALQDRIRLNHSVTAAAWSSVEARWTVHVEVDGKSRLFSCRFLYMCSGYYDYGRGYLPELSGVERFRGMVVHPQQWPEGLNYANKDVVVIGSGATAVTLVPELAKRARHVTMLQRSPSYIVSLPSEDRLAKTLRRVLPPKLAHAFTRWKNVLWDRSSTRSRESLPKRLKGRSSSTSERLLTLAMTSRRTFTLGTSLGINGCASCPMATSSRQ